jgi:hypothetical protein
MIQYVDNGFAVFRSVQSTYDRPKGNLRTEI